MRNNIPSELRLLPQWVVAGPDKRPLNPRTGRAASVTDPSTWATFDEVTRSSYKHIGFVLTDRDPYTIIDLDNKLDNPLTADQIELHKKILSVFDSYTEFSTSGRGFHIVVRGKIPAGVHSADGVEVYSTGRYMICTGNVYGPHKPITECQDLLDGIYGQLKTAESIELVDRDSPLSDEELVEMAMRADNGEKFDDLCQGKWQEMGYPSQSEADYALLAILAFYTPDNEQVRRLFRYSLLGRREKAQKNNVYIDRCLAKIRAVQNPGGLVDSTALLEKAKSVAGAFKASEPEPVEKPKDPTPTVTQAPTEKPRGGEISKPDFTKPIPRPPGLIGDLADYFYQTAVRPSHEVSLCAALAATAGVAGRAYNISNSGLNLYILIIARTGIGKEAASSGISRLWSAIRPTIPTIDDFLGPGTFASGQALMKTLSDRPCFVSVLGEFGITLHQLSDPRATSAEKVLKKALLDLFSKSGWTDYLGAMKYSNKENDTAGVHAPCVTILGETNPDTFFGSLDSSHIAEGLIPRFLIVEVNAKRPPSNENHGCPPPEKLVRDFSELAYKALSSQNNQANGAGFQAVALDSQAHKLLKDFDVHCDAMMNGESVSNIELELWNRAHLKALKLSGLVSVGVNPHTPIVNQSIAQWAIDFVIRDVHTVSSRYAQGDIGQGDSKKIFDIRRVIEDYFRQPYEKLSKYEVEKDLHEQKVIPYTYLQRRTSNLSAFKNDRRGATFALQSGLSDLIDQGYIAMVPPQVSQKKFKSSAKLYLLVKKWNAFPVIR